MHKFHALVYELRPEDRWDAGKRPQLINVINRIFYLIHDGVHFSAFAEIRHKLKRGQNHDAFNPGLDLVIVIFKFYFHPVKA